MVTQRDVLDRLILRASGQTYPATPDMGNYVIDEDAIEEITRLREENDRLRSDEVRRHQEQLGQELMGELDEAIARTEQTIIALEGSQMSASYQGCSFGQALAWLKMGWRVARPGWNGKGMFIFMIKSWTYTDGRQDNFPNLPFIAMKTAQDEVVPWLASQTDMLAEDWIRVDANV